MTPAALQANQMALLQAYERFGLLPFLERLRHPGRYAGSDGVNLLTTCVPVESEWQVEVTMTLKRAQDAGRRKRLIDRLLEAQAYATAHPNGKEAVRLLEASLAAASQLDEFESALSQPGVGISRALNPYTDWVVEHLEHEPEGWVIILGVDWYPISDLYAGADWFEYLPDPFTDPDKFWRTVWSWMLNLRSPTGHTWQGATSADTVSFMAQERVGVIFHNPVPYLRPPGVDKDDDKWLNRQLGDKGLQAEFASDIRLLRASLKKPSVAICTGDKTAKVLSAAGVHADDYFVWSAHPSQKFGPTGQRPVTLRMQDHVLPRLRKLAVSEIP